MYLLGVSQYRISGIFRVGLIFAEFATSQKSPKIDTAKNKPYYTSSLRVLEITKIGLSENFNTPSKRHFRQNFPTRKIHDIRYIDIHIWQYMKNLYHISIQNSYHNTSQVFFLQIKLFIFHSILVLYQLQFMKV